MKCWIVSDLHLEFDSAIFMAEMATTTHDYDVVILAGDIHFGANVLPILNEFNKLNKPVFYVLGNHEYYYSKILNQTNDLKLAVAEAQLNNIYVLDKDIVEFNNVIFVGATLWSDFEGNDPSVKLRCQEIGHDFSVIKFDNEKLTPDNVVELHKQDLAFLENALKDNAGRNIVVISHHSPSNQMKNVIWSKTRFTGDFSGAYSSDLDDLLREYSPALWVHGHLHDSLDFKIDDVGTRVVCNPRGYYTPDLKKLNKNFDIEFTVEI